MVVDALSRKAESMGSLSLILAEEWPLALDVQSLANGLVRLDILEPSRVLACSIAHCSLFKQIKARQYGDPHLLVLRESVLQGAAKEVTIGIVSVCHRDGSVLFDPGSTYSYVFSYFAHCLDMPRESLVLVVHVSSHVGDIIIVDCVYRSCVVTIGYLETRVDLLLLSMVDFDVILGMGWLSPYHAVLDYHANAVTLAMLGLPRVKWSGSIDYVPSRVISYLKAQWMVENGCLYYLAFVRDVSAEAPAIDSVPLVGDFLDVFPVDL
ncbi:uncharacterized protein [Nicotiana tomentosiformis]|uniref:uncharacterized protein n=1 Tax=Nicotiana tomentosiformis TaxID=4098 RepID=UPI00388C4185